MIAILLLLKLGRIDGRDYLFPPQPSADQLAGNTSTFHHRPRMTDGIYKQICAALLKTTCQLFSDNNKESTVKNSDEP
jgi:hypothetical protein